MKIDIGVACIKGVEHYILHLMESIKKTASGENDFEFIVGLNTSDINCEMIKNNPCGYKVKFVEKITKNLSSIDHGIVLTEILNNITSTIGMVIDSDVAL